MRWWKRVSRPVLRAAAPEDLAAFRAIQRQSTDAAQWDAEQYLKYDSTVGVIDGRVAGFIVSRQTAPGEREILNVAVDRDFRRQGLATALIRHELERGAADVFLEVRGSNAAARKLYQKLGFTDAGVRPEYYEDPPEAAIVMRYRS